MNNTSPQPMPDQPSFMSDEQPATYEAPAIVYESELEVRAGSPLGLPDPFDLTGTNK